MKIITQFNYIHTAEVPKGYQCFRLVSALNALKTISRKNLKYRHYIRDYRKKEKEIYKKILISKMKDKTRYKINLFALKINKNPQLPINLGRRCRYYQSGRFTIGECTCVTQEEFNKLKNTRNYSDAEKIKEQKCE